MDSRDEAFGHVCGRCLTCCRKHVIGVNPYEVARLAGRFGMTTGAFAEAWTDGAVQLKRRADGSCAFLNEQGCGVYEDRPLPCRLYPLGLNRQRGGVEVFSRLTLHPESKGKINSDGTIRAFLQRQDAEPFMEAGRRYYEFMCAAEDLLATQGDGEDEVDEEVAGEEVDVAALLLDMDGAIAAHCAAAGVAEPVGLEARMTLHLEILHAALL